MRKAAIRRTTKETDIACRLALEGRGRAEVSTGIPYFDHMLEAFAKHGEFDLRLKAVGDLHVDPHHTVEDCGIVLGQAFAKALGSRKGISRAGFFAFPMDEALALAAVDLCERPVLVWSVRFRRERIAALHTDLVEEFFKGLAHHLRMNLHVKVPYGWQDHHKCEAVFKAVGRAMAMAVRRDRRARGSVASTKGML